MIKINEISLEDCIRLHKEMWMYISEHLDEELRNDNSYASQLDTRNILKKRYCRKLVEDKIIDDCPIHFCFFCQYGENYDDYNPCEYCPGIWKTEGFMDKYYCECEEYEYSKNVLNWILSNPEDIANIKIKKILKIIK